MNKQRLPKKLSSKQLETLCALAVNAAQKSGQWIAGVDRGRVQGHFKNTGSSGASQIVTEVDTQSEAIIRRCLSESVERISGLDIRDITFVGEDIVCVPDFGVIHKSIFYQILDFATLKITDKELVN